MCCTEVAAGTANISNTWLIMELKHYFTFGSEALLTAILVAWVNFTFLGLFFALGRELAKALHIHELLSHLFDFQ